MTETIEPCGCSLCAMYYGDQAPTREELEIAGYKRQVELLQAENTRLKEERLGLLSHIGVIEAALDARENR